MDNVVALGQMPPQAGVPQNALVRCLEEALELARDGKLQSFVGTGFTSDGERLSVWYDTHPDLFQMLGSLAWLQHEYVDRKSGD